MDANSHDARNRAEIALAEAKRRFTRAARLALAGDPDAPPLAQEAYADVVRARAELQMLNEVEGMA